MLSVFRYLPEPDMLLHEILRIGKSPLARELTHVVDVLDTIHNFPRIPAIPLAVVRSLKEEGAYHSLSRPARAVKITISVRACFPGLTLLHEIGHLLDHLALNPIRQGFGSECDSNFEELWALWKASRPLRQLHAAIGRSRPLLSPKIGRFLRYQARISEVWARTYVQWAVVRSKDLLLSSQFRASRSQSMWTGIPRDFYWDDAEWPRIMAAVDDLFRTAGLL
jgi:hypothetical protein